MRTNIRPVVSRLVIPALLLSVGLARVAGAAPGQAQSLRMAPLFRLEMAGRCDPTLAELRCVWNEPAAALLAAVAVDGSGDDVSVLIQDARRYIGRLRFADARDKALSATRQEPANAKAHALLGIALLHLEDLSSGEKELEQALDRDRKCALAHAGLGILSYKKALSPAGSAAGSSSSSEIQKTLRRAEDEFNEALRLDSTEPSAHDGLGSIYYYRTQYSEAKNEFRAAVKQDPEFAASYFNLGNVCLVTRQWVEAEASYRKAISIYSRADFHALLAAALQGQGKANEAQKEAKEARRLGLASHWIYKELQDRGWTIGGLALQPPHAPAG
jgi:tetratricopeptide (TPR) repeat protein